MSAVSFAVWNETSEVQPLGSFVIECGTGASNLSRRWHKDGVSCCHPRVIGVGLVITDDL